MFVRETSQYLIIGMQLLRNVSTEALILIFSFHFPLSLILPTYKRIKENF